MFTRVGAPSVMQSANGKDLLRNDTKLKDYFPEIRILHWSPFNSQKPKGCRKCESRY